MLYPPQNNDTWSFTLSWIIGIQGISFSTDCWSPHLLKRWTVFVFSPVLLLLLRMLQLRSNDHPSMALSGDSRLRTGQDAHCTLELCREPPACCKYLSFGMAGKPAEQLNTVVRSCEELWLRGAAWNFGCEEQRWTAWKVRMYYLVWRKPTIPFMVGSEVNSG